MGADFSFLLPRQTGEEENLEGWRVKDSERTETENSRDAPSCRWKSPLPESPEDRHSTGPYGGSDDEDVRQDKA